MTTTNYDIIIEKLQSNHFYPIKEVLKSKKGDRVTSLLINCPPILNNERKKRILEVLDGIDVAVTWFPNQQQLKIKLKDNGKR